MTDGDWFEQRIIDENLKTVAYIETIGVPANSVEGAEKEFVPWSSKKSLCLEIEEKMNIPAFVVWHNEDCDDFLVLRITERWPKRMNKTQYAEFIRSL